MSVGAGIAVEGGLDVCVKFNSGDCTGDVLFCPRDIGGGGAT